MSDNEEMIPQGYGKNIHLKRRDESVSPPAQEVTRYTFMPDEEPEHSFVESADGEWIEAEHYTSKCAELELVYGYASGLFKLVAPQCEPLGDAAGVLSQLDNYITGLRAELERVKLERDEARKLRDEHFAEIERARRIIAEQIKRAESAESQLVAVREQTLEEVAARFDGRASVHYSERVASEIRSLLPPPPADGKDESRQ
jgi:hypothetical protein